MNFKSSSECIIFSIQSTKIVEIEEIKQFLLVQLTKNIALNSLNKNFSFKPLALFVAKYKKYASLTECWK